MCGRKIYKSQAKFHVGVLVFELRVERERGDGEDKGVIVGLGWR